MLKLMDLLKRNNQTLVTAESLTGGLIASKITSFPGASTIFWGGFVTYTNASKSSILEIPLDFINGYGAVSKEVAIAMAEGALRKSGATFSISVTGYAGPDSDRDMLGVVFIAVASKNSKSHIVEKYRFSGSREDVRRETVDAALSLLTQFIVMESINA